ncbi:hypothetical protein VP1G_09488 [Cytospora mali]|uniref:Protein kinase domain-containing protein n=1 Tax=Cytospora mali TaxID=578113 RepID=A0A194VF15_CYTMA|nr:hypothetical protein VP1G_09488 [Valsa mali var. pyri (nom. inval.)]
MDQTTPTTTTTTSTAATWFDTSRIESTVTRQFACAQLLPDEIEQLDRPLAFGDGLTDCTYWEWIESKAKRLFLILVDLDVADQIFGVVDDSWEDDDLPIALNQVERLSLTANKDPKTERKFYLRQFHYLLRTLDRGAHVDYQELEVVPVDVCEKRPGLTLNHDVDRVALPNMPGKVFCRRRFPIGPEVDCLSYEEFMSEISSIENLQNEHIVSYWASYTHQGYGYVLFSPASEYRLSAYLANTPSSIKHLDKLTRRRMVLDWIHCLVDTLCYMHSRGMFLGNIKPSTIHVTHDNHIFYAPSSPLNPDASHGTSSFDKESYDYAAPEQRAKPTKPAAIIPRSRPTGPSSSRGAPAPASSIKSGRSGHTEHKLAPPRTPPSPSPSPSPSQQHHHHHSPHHNHHHHHNPHHHHHHDPPRFDPQAADIFSTGCIILDLLSHGLLKRSTSSFASHRGAKHKVAGRGGAVLDSSFHKNLGQVETWMAGLAKDAAKKAAKDGSECAGLYKGAAALLRVVDRMVSPHPGQRPAAAEVQRAVYEIITEVGGIAEPHCADHQHQQNHHRASTAGARDSGTMATIEEAAMYSAHPAGFGFSNQQFQYDYDSEYHNDSSSSARRSNSLRSFMGLGHRRDTSDDSSRSKSSSSNQSHGGERRELGGSGLKAMQNLRISKSWQAAPHAERDVASRHSR